MRTRSNPKAGRSGGRAARRAARRKDRPAGSAASGPGLKGEGFRPLSAAELARVHDAALTVLATVGMAGPTPEILELAEAKGCRRDEAGRLQFPRALVEDVIAGAAKGFVMHGRDPAHDLEIRPGEVHFCTGGAAVKMLDIDSRQYRPSTLVDLYDLARLCDTLSNIRWVTRPVVATDLEDWFELDANTVYACAAGTTKHIGTSLTLGAHVPRLEPLFDLLAGGEGRFRRRPFHSVHATTIVSPLGFAADSCDVALAAARIAMPVLSLNGPQAGATAPAALAGTLVQAVAEALAALTVVNLARPGHPVIMGNWPFVSDLRSGAFTGGGGEQAVLAAASAQMSHFYGLPAGAPAGMTDSKLPDNQAGFEKGITPLMAGLAATDFVYESAGMLASLLGCSFEAMIVDDEMLSNVKRAMQGIEVSEDSLSVEVIAEAARDPGHYLGHAQTLALMESEYVYPRYSDRASPDAWQEQGASDIWAKARERAREVLARHFPRSIDAACDAEIRARYPIRLSTDDMTAATCRWAGGADGR